MTCAPSPPARLPRGRGERKDEILVETLPQFGVRPTNAEDARAGLSQALLRIGRMAGAAGRQPSRNCSKTCISRAEADSFSGCHCTPTQYQLSSTASIDSMTPAGERDETRNRLATWSTAW